MRMKLQLRIAARMSRHEGKLTEEQFQHIMTAIRHPEQRRADGTSINLLTEIENHVTTEMGKQGFQLTWDSVVQWFKDHWLQILQLLLSLAPILFLAKSQEKPNDT